MNNINLKNSSFVSKLVLTIFSMISLSACGYVGGSITDLLPGQEDETRPTTKFSTAEIISGSLGQQVTTPSGYRVQASVGSPVAGAYVATPGAYKVYQGVQGEIVSE